MTVSMKRVARAVDYSKDVFTTGEVAAICHVAPRSVSKWIDGGELRGYRLPGSNDRRVERDELVAFLDRGTMPCPVALRSGGRVRTLSSEVVMVRTAGGVCRDIPLSLSADPVPLMRAVYTVMVRKAAYCLIGPDYGVGLALEAAAVVAESCPSCRVCVLVGDDVAVGGLRPPDGVKVVRDGTRWSECFGDPTITEETHGPDRRDGGSRADGGRAAGGEAARPPDRRVRPKGGKPRPAKGGR